MTQSTDVVEFVPEHRSGLVAMYQRNFGDWSTERFSERWDWQGGARNPWRALRPVSGLVAVHGGVVVGGMVLFPVPWRLDGQRLILLCGGEFAIDRGHRMSVMLPLISRMLSMPPITAQGVHPALRKVAIRLGAHHLPISRARLTIHLRLGGWLRRAIRRRVPGALHRFISPGATRWLAAAPIVSALRRFSGSAAIPHARALPREAPRADLRSFDKFGDEYDRLWRAANANFRITVDKDAQYMNWRYLQCPTFRHPILRGLYREGRLVGVVVAGVYAVLDGQDGPCGINGEILELITVDATAAEIESLVLEACRELDRRGVDQIGAFAFDDATRAAFERIGFQPEADERFDTMVLFSKPQRHEGRAYPIERVYITAGDGDILNSSLN